MISSSEGIRGARKPESWVATLAPKFRSGSYEAGPSHQEGYAHNTAIEYCTFRPRIFRIYFPRTELSTIQYSFGIGIPSTKTNAIFLRAKFLALTCMLMNIQVSLNNFRIQKSKKNYFWTSWTRNIEAASSSERYVNLHSVISNRLAFKNKDGISHFSCACCNELEISSLVA